MRKKLENFWYYYKIPVVLGAIFLIGILMYFTIDLDTAPTDLNICLVTEDSVTPSIINFNEAMPDLISDANGDGIANITVSTLFIGKDADDPQYDAYVNSLNVHLAQKGSTLFLFDKTNLERMLKKDAFCPLDRFLDISAYGDRVIYRNGEPIALALSGSKVFADMNFEMDELYAMLLFVRPGEENDPKRMAEYKNASLVLTELSKLS